MSTTTATASATAQQQSTTTATNSPVMERYISKLAGGDPTLAQRALEIYSHFKDQPITDIHTHYSVAQIRDNIPWKSPTDFFLGTPPKFIQLGDADYGFDHYVAQIMMKAGVSQEVIFGDLEGFNKRQLWNCQFSVTAEEFQKLRFTKMIDALKNSYGGTVEFWFRTEVSNIFRETFNLSTQPEALWDAISLKLKDITPQSLLQQHKVLSACTTDDPTDTLERHSQQGGPRLIPTFRPDRVLMIGENLEIRDRPNMSPTRYHFTSWIDKLAQVSGQTIKNVADLEAALRKRIEYFKERGCVAADLGITNFKDVPCTEQQANDIFSKKMAERSLSREEVNQWQSYMLYKLLSLNGEYGLRQFIHQGASRDMNTALFKSCGADIGGDGQGERLNGQAMVRIFDRLKQDRGPTASSVDGLLAPTVIFPINQDDFEEVINNVTALGLGVTSDGSLPIQLGPPWWFADNEKDVREMIRLHLSKGTLHKWVGMLSDARSLGTVVARFDWFRALLAVELAQAATLGDSTAAEIAGHFSGVCYRNGNAFLGVQ